MKRVLVLDYGLGNVKSIANALSYLGAAALVSRQRTDIARADAMIIPGVGAFAAAMDRLRRHGLVPAVGAHVAARRPLLGICLGFQVLARRSTEHGAHPGLGFIDAEVRRLSAGPGIRLPHIAWAEVSVAAGRSCTLLDGMSGQAFYFLHSFAVWPDASVTSVASTRYGGTSFCSYAELDRIYGVQFHPERSGEAGLAVLDRFLGLI